MSNKIEDLCEQMIPFARAFVQRMNDLGIPFVITETLRTLDRQKQLYAQGRTTPGQIVTWTMQSKHLQGKAFDICIMKDGKMDWNTGNPDWQHAGEIGEGVGLEWGGRWKHPDYPHFQLKEI